MHQTIFHITCKIFTIKTNTEKTLFRSIPDMDRPGFPITNCTLSTCSLSNAEIYYLPSLGGNGFYIGIFSLALVSQIIFGLWYRTWGFMVGLFCGLVLEIVGYAARVQMHYNPFPKGPFVM
jgi:hypothetical protein